MLTCALPTELVIHCLEFVGPGSYRFIAGTCHMLKQLYETIEPDHSTWWTRACASVECARLCYSDHEHGDGDNGPYTLQHIVITAARLGRLSILQWANERGIIWNQPGDTPDWNYRACELAASNGHLDVLRYLHDVGCDWNDYACVAAADNGHLDVLKFLHEHGCSWDSYACDNAKQLDVFENEFEWAEHVCYYAARNGHLEIVQYLHLNGCEWDDKACSAAAENGHVAVLQYLHENNSCECCVDGHFLSAIYNGRLNVIQYLHEKQYEWNYDDCLELAGMYGQGDIVQWIRQQTRS